jgi:hypothetical protein
MKTTLQLTVLFLFLYNITYSQCQPEQQKMLVLGDSWAFFSWTNDSYNENMDRFGLTDYKAYSTASLSVNGTQADNYFTPERVQELTDALNDNPTIEYIHFSLGGNDILGTYNVANSASQNQQDYNTLMTEIKAGIDIIHNINPNLKVLLAGYDYPNFEETIMDFPVPSQHPFYSQWDDMGQPNFSQLNAILIEVTAIFADSAAAWNNVAFVNNLGLMQNTYGQNTPLSIAPGGTYAAGSLTVPGGMPDYPSPTQALNFGGIDSFHLSNGGYENFIKRHFKEYYWNALRNADATIYATDSILNGTVTSTSATSDSLAIGSETSILSFNTTTLDPLQNIVDASIFLKRSDLNGPNLIAEDLYLEIKSGYFGATLQLELDDFNADSDSSSIACTYGTVDENDAWLRVDLPQGLLSFINTSGTTQFRLNYNNVNSGNYFKFYNTTNNEQQAILDVKYAAFANVENLTKKDIKAFPNPFNNELFIESYSIIKKVEVFDVNGRKIKSISNLTSKNISINTSDLEKGVYFFNVYNNDGSIIAKKMIK